MLNKREIEWLLKREKYLSIPTSLPIELQMSLVLRNQYDNGYGPSQDT